MRDLIGGMLFMAGAKLLRPTTLRAVINKVQPPCDVHVNVHANLDAEEFRRQMRRALGGAA